MLKGSSPLSSPNKDNKLINVNNTNNKLFYQNLDKINLNTELFTYNLNQPSYSKISQKNIYISIKHNNTNLCKDKLIDNIMIKEIKNL